MSLPGDQQRHEVQLQRLITRILNSEVYPTLDASVRRAIRALNEAGELRSATQVNALIREINAPIRESMTAAWAKVTEELEELATYEAGFYAELLQKYGAPALSVPAADRVNSYIARSLISLGDSASPKTGTWSQFIMGNIDAATGQIDNTIRAGFVRGQTVPEVSRGLRTIGDGMLKRNADALARTGLSHYTTRAHEAMARDNADILEKKYLLVTFDNRTTFICMRYGSSDANPWRIDDPKAPVVPLHYNCLVGDSVITASSAVSGVTKRAFKGKVVNIKTESGKSLTVTPNHPILTDSGWTGAQFLNVGDSVFSERSSQPVRGFNMDDYGVEPTIEDIFESSGRSLGMETREVKLSAPDFHGDAADNEVAIVRTDVLLSNEVESVLSHDAGKFVFDRRALNGAVFKTRLRSFAERIKAVGFAPYANAIALGALAKDLYRDVLHSCGLLFRCVPDVDSSRFELSSGKINMEAVNLAAFGQAEAGIVSFEKIRERGLEASYGAHRLLLSSIPDFDPTVSKGLSDHGEVCVEALAQLANTGAGEVFRDRIVDIFISEFDGHVYNLQTLSETYTANGIITHNCRSTYVYMVKGQDTLSGTRPVVGGKGDKQAREIYERRKERLRTKSKVTYRGRRDSELFDVKQMQAGTPYDKWFARQPAWFQDSTIGPTRGKLYRQGGFELRQFSDMTGRELSLAELRQIDAEAFNRLGI